MNKIVLQASIRQQLQSATFKLKAFATARLDAEILLAHVLNKPRSYLFAWPEQILPLQPLQDYQQYIQRRARGEPVAYITERREFYSLQLQVTPATLIPRNETELLVQLALDTMPKSTTINLLDLGTGSGAIAIALALARPNWQITAVDKSLEALIIAKKNAEQYHVKNIRFIHSDWFLALEKNQFHCIIANPPYIASDDICLQNIELSFEPEEALIAHENGFSDLKKIIGDASEYFTTAGYLMLEHGALQASVVAQCMRQQGYQDIVTIKDIAKHDRVTLAKMLPLNSAVNSKIII